MANINMETQVRDEDEFVVLDSDDFAEVAGGLGDDGGVQQVGSAFKA